MINGWKNMETMRVMVTGSSGFLGRHVLNQLLERGHDVLGFDIATPERPVAPFVKGDFTSKEDLSPRLRKMDAVCHVGAVGDVYLADRDPALAFRVNAFGTHIVSECCVSAGVRKLVYASTWEVYGLPEYQPIDEHHPCNPATSYSISKLAGELVARGKAPGSIILRLGTAYGPFMRSSSVIRRFVETAASGKGITVLGDGTQFRQFTHAMDIARAFQLSVESEVHEGVFNIVSGESTTIEELARLVSGFYSVPIEHKPQREGDPPSGQVSSRLAGEKLGWTSSIAFADGMAKVIDWIEEQHLVKAG